MTTRGAAGVDARRALTAPRESSPLTERHVELLRGLARQPVSDRRGSTPRELEDLVARGLASSAFVGHAGIEVRITEAGTRALAALEAPPASSVYDAADVREELGAFLAAWFPSVGEARTAAFKANLAFLLDLVVERGIELEHARIRRALQRPAGANEQTRAVEAALRVLALRPVRRPRGRSSRPGGRVG